MEFFCYRRDRLGSMALRSELLEEHWSYMDRYAAQMIARGPTFADDGDTPTGSVHIVDLPDSAARAFAFDEPNHQAGVYRDVLVRRWRHTLGRTMWDFPGGRTGGHRYLVLGLGRGQPADQAVRPHRDELIAYGRCCPTTAPAGWGRRCRDHPSTAPAPTSEDGSTGSRDSLDTVATALVIENDPTDDLRRLGAWLSEAGLDLRVLRAHAGEQLPDDLDGHAAFVVLGGEQRAYPLPDGTLGAPWFPALEGLLRKAVRHRVPTLAICLGAQLLATAHAGTAERSPAGPEIGPALVAKRDAADTDPLFRWVPLAPDVLQWHEDEVTELPHGAVLLAASTRYPHQAFRLGDRAWGLQFHIECDTAMIADWATDSALLAELGYDPQAVVAACAAVMADIEEVWQPFAARFAALALGQLDVGPGPQLPLLGR